MGYRCEFYNSDFEKIYTLTLDFIPRKDEAVTIYGKRYLVTGIAHNITLNIHGISLKEMKA